MLQARFGRALLTTILGIPLAVGLLIGCGGSGSTNDDPAQENVGAQFVSDGGAGATIKISVLGELTVGERVDFQVALRDPQGNPLSFIRIFCESEAGIAILEPSRGGVAFESTGAAGVMSGVLGGVTPGSFILECRAEEGFNLVDRVSILITGDVPVDFDGFPGAAGGNLGGQLIVEDANLDEALLGISNIVYLDGSRVTTILDSSQDPDCNPDPMVVDPEPFFFKNYQLTIGNTLDEPLSIQTVNVTVVEQGGAVIAFPTQFLGLDLAAGSTTTLGDLFIDSPNYAGTATPVSLGTHTATFTVVLEGLLSGDTFTLSDSQTFTYTPVDNCP